MMAISRTRLKAQGHSPRQDAGLSSLKRASHNTTRNISWMPPRDSEPCDRVGRCMRRTGQTCCMKHTVGARDKVGPHRMRRSRDTILTYRWEYCRSQRLDTLQTVLHGSPRAPNRDSQPSARGELSRHKPKTPNTHIIIIIIISNNHVIVIIITIRITI